MRKRDGWYSVKRSYIHFDLPISFNKATSIVGNPEKVAQWNFLPFLHTTIHSSKVTRNKNGDLVRKEKHRDIRYAGHADSHIYSYYSLLLSTLYEQIIQKHRLGGNVLGFRKILDENDHEREGKCNIHFAKQAFDDIANKSPCSAISFDIEKFFDELDHTILKRCWTRIIGKDNLPNDHYSIYKSLTRYSYVDRDYVFKLLGINRNSKRNGRYRICTIKEFRDIIRASKLIYKNDSSRGIPQGSPISGLLSNIYLIDFDIKLKQLAEKYNAIYYRYCDDIIIICDNCDEIFFKNIVYGLLHKHKVKANDDKTVVRKFKYDNQKLTCDYPVQYLGFVFDGQRTVIRSSSYIRFLHKMRKGVELARQTRHKYNVIRNRKGVPQKWIYRKKLYSRYSYLGRRNFISYAHKAARIMSEQAIKKQVKPLWNRLLKRIRHAEL